MEGRYGEVLDTIILACRSGFTDQVDREQTTRIFCKGVGIGCGYVVVDNQDDGPPQHATVVKLQKRER